jgi:hypothetical protein
MRSFLIAAFLTIFLIPVLLIGGCYYKWWQFDHIEDRARRAITAAELQTWATNVLAQAPSYSPSEFHQLRTNYPAKLRSVCRGPGVCWISVPDPESDYLMIIWSMKPSGDAAFEIGGTNFVSAHPKARAWAPGVYFYRR